MRLRNLPDATSCKRVEYDSIWMFRFCSDHAMTIGYEHKAIQMAAGLGGQARSWRLLSWQVSGRDGLEKRR